MGQAAKEFRSGLHDEPEPEAKADVAPKAVETSVDPAALDTVAVDSTVVDTAAVDTKPDVVA
jgi:hypothetical protein